MSTGASISNYLEVNILNHFLKAGGSAAIAQPAGLYVGIFTDATGIVADQPTTEAVIATCPGYARQVVAFSAPTSGPGTTANSGIVTFTATGSWLTSNYVGIFDALTTGNLLFWGPLTASKTLANGDSLNFAVGQISIAID